jgi:hypothetical protein
MQNTITINTGAYGFGHEWTLSAFGKPFYLGQDVKFCKRVLGMTPSEVVYAIGTNRLDLEEGRNTLAEFIINKLGLTEESLQKVQPWELCAQ